MNQQNTIIRVKSGFKGFEEAFNSLPRNKIKDARQELMSRLVWSISVFYYKKRGDTPIWEHELPVIEEVFSRYRVNPWNGESINNN
jgi:hypothetical protein